MTTKTAFKIGYKSSRGPALELVRLFGSDTEGDITPEEACQIGYETAQADQAEGELDAERAWERFEGAMAEGVAE